MTARITYRRKHTYRTRSNKVRRFRTPGGKLSVQYVGKKPHSIVCGDTQVPLQGIPCVSKTKFKSLPKRQRTVSRPYGGCITASAVRHRILRAFFNEELRVIKQAATASKKGKKKQQGRKK